MEQNENKLFRQSAVERISSPEQLDEYIRVSNPSVWVVIAAILILAAALLVWSVYGTLPTTIPGVCIAEGGSLTCYEADAGDIRPGMTVRIGDYTGTVESVSDMPYSSEEIGKRYDSDYTLHMLGVGDWNYEVIISAPDVPDGLVEATIVTDEVHPIAFIFN